MMTASDVPNLHRNRRFYLENDVIIEDGALTVRSGRYLQQNANFFAYASSFGEYLRYLGGNDYSKSTDCPFCLVGIADGQYQFQCAPFFEKFVADQQRHDALWSDGVILKTNRAGWHLLNELLIPREHDAIEHVWYWNCLRHGIERWSTHRAVLSRALNGLPACLYHALVVNHVMGQSVRHPHVHCYSSVHPPIELFRRISESGELILNCGPEGWQWLASDQDHPAVFVRQRAFAFEGLAPTVDALLEVSRIVEEAYVSLFGFIPPASAGWFFLDQHLVYAFIPMQRDGTIQHFQGDMFRKFGQKELLMHLASALCNSMEATTYSKVSRLVGPSVSE